jgi:hypothetical protein
MYCAVPSPATVDCRLKEEIYAAVEDPRVFTVETKLEVFRVVRDTTVEVSCAREIYPTLPSPVIVEIVAFEVIL